MTVALAGRHRCDGCNSTGRVANTFTNGVGWRRLCDPCADAPIALPQVRRPRALPRQAGTAR
ncbi:hypothetical protein FHR91_003056 [Erythrobacter lutimaris]|nr:hypothetical protein [Alteriqipengyuania lutimaris]